MSKFAKALRQAEHDAALGPRRPSPIERPRESNGSWGAKEAAAPASARPPAVPAAEIADDHLVSLLSPAAFEAEQYRALRHVVEELARTTSVKVMAVSSPAVGDGKTTTAINLAGTLAQSPQARVLLIDADVRRPAVATMLRHPDLKPGLADAILDPACTLDQIIQGLPQFNLAFIHAGRSLPRNPYELLKSGRCTELLEEARQRFDYVVVDTPPLAVVQDCRLIASWVDGFLVVVAANRTPRRLVEEALAALDPAKIFGLVFNADAEGPHVGYYGYTNSYLQAPSPPAPPARASARGFPWTWRRRAELR
jgi:capsular exopolysaccharide synthesis family protein